MDKAEKALAKAVMASPGFREFARVFKECERLREEVAKARESNPERAWANGLAKSTGDKGAQEYVDRTRPDDPELLVYLADLAKAAPTTPDGRRAQELLDKKEREARERRGQGRSR